MWLSPAKCRLLPKLPTLKHTGQKSGSNLCGNFQILIVSAVKICKQCLQTTSASGWLRPQTPYRGFASNSTGGLCSPDILGYPLPHENSLRRQGPKTQINCGKEYLVLWVPLPGKLPVSYVLTGNLLTGNKLPATNITGNLRTLGLSPQTWCLPRFIFSAFVCRTFAPPQQFFCWLRSDKSGLRSRWTVSWMMPSKHISIRKSIH